MDAVCPSMKLLGGGRASRGSRLGKPAHCSPPYLLSAPGVHRREVTTGSEAAPTEETGSSSPKDA